MRSPTLFFLFAGLVFSPFSCAKADSGRILGRDMKIRFTRPIENAQNPREIFTKAKLYGRIRINSFFYERRKPTTPRRTDKTAAIGGSLLFRSARYEGFAIKAAFYTSQNPFHPSREEIPYLKAAKDTLSRYDAMRKGEFGMAVLAEGYLEYRIHQTRFRVGRQIFESRTTASNDTKMIPNTFEGYSLVSEALPKTTLKLGYFTRQKLRDHTRFHSPLSYGDDPADLYASWSQNDDTAMHRGLGATKLDAAGIKPRLIVAEIRNRPSPALSLLANYTIVPDLVALLTTETCYRYFLNDTCNLSGAVRHIRQFDEGAGKIGGANLRNDPTGYTDPRSIEGELWALRLDFEHEGWRLRLGYSKSADKADLITPWRAFPTAGFTRAMGEYNWYADTLSRMVRFDCDLERYGLMEETTLSIRYVTEDFDDDKPATPADCDVLECDIQKRFVQKPNLYLRMRIASVEGRGPHTKSDPSHRDYRLELNYLF